jgi:signal transduction histidine kinase
MVRRALRRLTIAVTATVLFSIPALFALAGIRALHEHVGLEAAITAERLAKYAQGAGSQWASDTDAVRDVISSIPSMGIQIERTVLWPKGDLLLPPTIHVDRPVLTAGAPVFVHGRRAAELTSTVSLWPILFETALVTMFSALIAAGLYLGIDRVVLRALRQALDHLQTAVRQRDSALQETSDALALLARQNTRLKAASEELSRTRDAALTADRSKSMFLAAMSHELRTPLNAIIGFSEIMARQLYGPIGHAKYRDYASDIRSSGDHLLALIDDVLDLSRVKAGKLVLRREPLDVVEQIKSCCRLVQRRATDSGIDLRFAPAANPSATILGDRVRFRQILLNVLTNAVKFTDSGGSVQVEVGDDVAGTVAIRIADTGIGMSDDDLERVFRPFEQAGVSGARAVEGVGLGLALSRALVREHDGTLNIASAPGRGTTVTLSFPTLLEPTSGNRRDQMSLREVLRTDDATDTASPTPSSST